MTDQPEKLFALLEEHAESLRKKGVRVVKIDGFEFALDAPPPVPLPKGEEKDDGFNHPDPFKDPALYGRTNGVPGFPRLSELRRQKAGR